MSTSGEFVGRYRKRPVEVEAMRYDGPAWVPERERHSTEAFRPLVRFTQGRATTVLVGTVTHGGPNQYAPAIRTLEGTMLVAPGDFVIKGVQGEFYPCKPDIFAATYEPVEASVTDRRLVSCGRCAGTGEYPPTDGDECSFCGGTGEVEAKHSGRSESDAT